MLCCPSRDVEEQTVVVFSPARTLEGDGCEAVVVELLSLDACIDGVSAEVLREGTGIETYAHLPSIRVPAACTTAEGIAYTTQQRGREAIDGSDVRHGMLPEQQVATVLDILLNDWSGVAGYVGEVRATSEKFQISSLLPVSRSRSQKSIR